jgi:hypothetical protein
MQSMSALILCSDNILANRNNLNVGDIFLPHLQRALQGVEGGKPICIFVWKRPYGIMTDVWNVGSVAEV